MASIAEPIPAGLAAPARPAVQVVPVRGLPVVAVVVVGLIIVTVLTIKPTGLMGRKVYSRV